MSKAYIANARKPIGALGKRRIGEMNKHHAPLVAWSLSFVSICGEERCLDLGCGGGATIAYLLNNLGASFCAGIDYSKVAIEETSNKNEEAIAEGKCMIAKADVSSLPFDNESFDLVTAVETIYFWPSPLLALKEANRVLEKGGRIIVINEDDGLDKEKANRLKEIMPNMCFYSGEDLESLLKEAGFKNIATHTKSPWVACVGEK
jgi:ubiquinone/menaquinone biosynthesis C-methylase UbiE